MEHNIRQRIQWSYIEPIEFCISVTLYTFFTSFLTRHASLQTVKIDMAFMAGFTEFTCANSVVFFSCSTFRVSFVRLFRLFTLWIAFDGISYDFIDRPNIVAPWKRSKYYRFFNILHSQSRTVDCIPGQ